jgi:hypothetical protein
MTAKTSPTTSPTDTLPPQHSVIEAQVLKTTEPSLPMTVSVRTATPETLAKVVTEAVDPVVAVVVLEAPALAVTTSTTALDTPVAT